MKTKSNILNVLKKELARFFGDKRLVFTTVIMPGLLIYIMYTLMGSFMGDLFSTADDYKFQAAVVNAPVEIENMLTAANFELYEISESEVASIGDELTSKNKDICLVFPDNFMNDIVNYDVASGKPAPEVKMYYVSSETNSSTAVNIAEAILDSLEESISNRFDINASNEQFDFATEADMTAKLVSMLMPMLLMVFLFAGCVSLAPDSIAGEKERGTIATLLVTPLKRSELAIGKILALAIMTVLSAICSFVGVMLSFPKLMGGTDLNIDASVYGVKEYVLLLGIIVSLVFFMIALVSVLSAFANSVKEAGTLITPLNLLVAIVGITGMIGGNEEKSLGLFFIPLVNSAQSMSGIFSLNINTTGIVITIIMNLVLACCLVVVLTKMFESEKIMFSK